MNDECLFFVKFCRLLIEHMRVWCTYRQKAGLKTSWRLRRRKASRTWETFRTRWRV